MILDDRTTGVIEGMIDAIELCGGTLAMYVHRPDVPALQSAKFWAAEGRRLLAQGIEARKGQDAEERLDAEHESPVAKPCAK